MARPDGRVEKGQKLSTAFSARAWNRAQDAADVVLGVTPGIEAETGGGLGAPYNWIYVVNKSGATVPRWGLLTLYDFEVRPTSDDTATATSSFQQMPVLKGFIPSIPNSGAWCVALEPIENDKIGRAAISGAVQIRAADIGSAAGAQLIYRNNDWALILIGGGMRLGTISSTWQKGTSATVTEQFRGGTAKTGNPTFTALNWFADITVTSGTKRVACGRVDDGYILIAAEC